MEKRKRDQILAFRLASHNLSRRLKLGSLVEAAAACGIQETPLGTAAVALLTRVEGLSPDALEVALAGERSLVTLWSVRGAPYVVPADDLGAFTAGALPLDAASFRQSLGGWSAALEEAGLDPFETLAQMVSAANDLLDGRTMNVNELRDAIYAQVTSLSLVKRPGFARDDMPEPLFRAVGTAGAACIVAGRGTDAELARLDQWLKKTIPRPDPAEARAELARRFLHCYGPASPQHFADWTQRSLADAKNAFSLIQDELAPITLDRKAVWFLRRDEDALASPPEPSGVRLLPVQDPYLQQRDRATVLEDKAFRRKLWQPVRGPGGVLANGEIVGTWRARALGKRLSVSVEAFDGLASSVQEEIYAEAERIAPFRGCDGVDFNVAGS
jgi:hypothetical protein